MRRSVLLFLFLLGCAHTQPRLRERPRAVPAWEHEDTVLAGRMRALAQRMRDQGYQPTGQSLSAFLPPAARRAEPFEVPAHTCVLWLTVSSDAIFDLDAAIYTPEGEQVADDQRADAAPVLGGCSDTRPRRFYLGLHAYQGGGPVLAVMFARPRGQAEPALLETHEAHVALLSQLRVLEAHGYSGATPVELPIAVDQPLRLPIAQARDSCFAVVVELSSGLGGVELVVESRGRVLARGIADAAVGGTQWCVSAPDSATLSLKATSGAGVISVARWSGPSTQTGGANALWMGEPVEERGSALEQNIEDLPSKISAR